MKDKPYHGKNLLPDKSQEWAQLLIAVWKKQDERDFDDLNDLVKRLLSLSGMHRFKIEAEQISESITSAYRMYATFDDDPQKSTKIMLFEPLGPTWLAIKNELESALNLLGVSYYNKSSYHHTCGWMYYSKLSPLKGLNEDKIIFKLKRYLFYFLILWHIYCGHRVKTGSYIGALMCTYLLFKGIKYAHLYEQEALGTGYLTRYHRVAQKYSDQVYMF